MWQWLHRRFGGNPQEETKIDPAMIDRLVNLASPHIRFVNNYREKLAPLIRDASHKTRSLGERLPKPIELTPENWRKNPLLSLVFANPERMIAVTAASSEVSDWFTNHPLADQAYAILAVTRAVESRYGMEERDGIVRQDVLQQVLVFRDHRFGALVDSEAALTQQAQCRGLEELAHHAARRIAGLETEKALIDDEIKTLRIALRLGGPIDPISASPLQRQRLKRLEFLTEELTATRQALEPEAQLGILMAALRTPEQELRITQSDLKVDLMGVLCPDNPHARQVSLFEIEMIADEPVRYTLLPVLIPRATAHLKNGGGSNSGLFSSTLL